MSLFDCIENAKRAGEMDNARSEAAQDLLRDLERRYSPVYGPEEARAMAARDLRRMLRENGQHKRRVVLAQIQAQRRLHARLRNYRNLLTENDQADGLLALFEHDEVDRGESIASIREALFDRYKRQIRHFLQQHGRNVLGAVRQRAREPNIVRELFNQGTGDHSAREMAQAIASAMELSRTEFNAAGGNIAKLDDFALPQSHNGRAIRQAGFDDWYGEISPLLDFDRIIDFETGRGLSAAPEGRRREVLQDIFETITTDGWNKREPSFQRAGRPALYNRRNDHRVLHFLGPDQWMAYNQRFGTGGVFETIVGHLGQMARDTAAMRVLGPNPNAGLEFAIQTATKAAVTRGWKLGAFNRVGFSDARAKTETRANTVRNMMAIYNGSINYDGNMEWARFMGGVRHFVVAVRLGAAMLSALTDVVFQDMASRHLGMKPMRAIGRQMRLLASAGQREQAARMGLIADHLAQAGVVQSRYMGEQMAPEIAERLSEFTMRASGLSAYTSMGRMAHQMEHFAFLAEHRNTSWSDLDLRYRERLLEARGFNEDDWDVIRSTPLHTDRSGATFLVPDDIRFREDIDPDRAEGLATRLSAAIREQTEFAVPSMSLRGQAFTQIGRAGTPQGELIRSALMFKSFSLTVLFKQLRRGLTFPTVQGRVGYYAQMGALLTIAGAVSLQSKEIAKGRDPRDMTTRSFLGAAILQGGGLGIFGDFLSASENRFGGGLSETLAGPVAGLGADLLQFSAGNMLELMAGEDTNAGRETVRLLRQNTPVQNLWYWNVAFQRLLWDNLQRQLDPEAEAQFRRAERRRVADFGNRSFFGPGDSAPRVPDFSNIVGGTP